MDRDVSLQRLKEAIQSQRETLEELESALLEFEEAVGGESQERPQARQGLELLSIPELCQELGMGKSWVYRRLRSGRAFGASGTPSAVLVDSEGKVASEVAVGAPAVLTLAGASQTEA